jgi:hypothetical protein
LSDLAREIAAGAVRLAAASAAWLRLVGEFDEREGWGGYGFRSCAEWLAYQCGLSPGPAREHVRVARALRRLPVLAAAFAGGRLSYSKVRALTRVAEPATEDALLEFAVEATASQVERTVRQWRRADALDEESTAARQSLEWWEDDDGMLVLRARMPAEQGAALVTAIESRAERDARRDRAARTKTDRQRAEDDEDRCDEDEAVAAGRERTTARRLAALAALAEDAEGRGRRPGDPPRRQVVVHLDAAVLAEDTAAGRAWIEGGPALSPAQARRLACEGTVVAMLERGREVLAVGRTRRLATRAQRLALLRRDGGCARPGCTETRIERLHAHHLRHWLHGGRTDLTNLVLLCDACHGLAHDLDLVMTRRDGHLVVTTPDGQRVWGPADTAFQHGTAHPADPEDLPEFVGVHPIDTVRGRRPQHAPTFPRERARTRQTPPIRRATRRPLSGRPPTAPATRTVRGRTPAPDIGALLFPAGEPPLPHAMHVNGERMDLRYVVSVLMGHRDFLRRCEAESGATASP